MNSDRVRQAYSAMAGVYLERLATMDVVHPDDRRLIERFLTGLDGPVLDLGCGPGHLSAHLHAAGCDVTGLDLVPEFLAHARATYPDVPSCRVPSRPWTDRTDRWPVSSAGTP